MRQAWRVLTAVVVVCMTALLSPWSPALANPGTWTGNGPGANWMTPGNWAGNIGPTAGETLDFPAVASQLTNHNDFPNFTAFNSFTFEGGGYTLGGNIVDLTGGITASNASGTNTVNLNGLQTTGAQTWTVTNAGAVLAVNDILTSTGSTVTLAGAGDFTLGYLGSSTPSIIKNGSGTATLVGNSPGPPLTVNAGTLLINALFSSSAATVNGGTLGGTGTVASINAVGGVVDPGLNAGTVTGILTTVSGDTFNSATTFRVQINGTTPGVLHDQLRVNAGTVNLGNATLSVSFGFTPSPGQAFRIIDIQSASPVVGTFNGLPPGATFIAGGQILQISYTGGTGNDVFLTVIGPAPTATPTATATATAAATATALATATPTACILGDMNCDGIVDIRDYGVWRQNFGQTNCGNPADLNGDCIVDIRDYGIWRANFGHTAGAAPASGALPAGSAPAPRGTPGPALLAADQPTGASGPLLPADGPGPAVPAIPVAAGLLGFGGLVGWRRHRPPGIE